MKYALLQRPVMKKPAWAGTEAQQGKLLADGHVPCQAAGQCPSYSTPTQLLAPTSRLAPTPGESTSGCHEILLTHSLIILPFKEIHYLKKKKAKEH